MTPDDVKRAMSLLERRRGITDALEHPDQIRGGSIHIDRTGRHFATTICREAVLSALRAELRAITAALDALGVVEHPAEESKR